MTDAMQEVEEEDGYSDDDLDALPLDTFQELQQNAIRSTQQPRNQGHFVRPTGSSPQLPVQKVDVGNFALSGNLSINPQLHQYPQQPSSDYGDFDDEMLDGEIFDAAEEPVMIAGVEGVRGVRPTRGITAREIFRSQPFAAPPQLRGYGGVQPLLHSRAISSIEQPNWARGKSYDDRDEPMQLASREAYESGIKSTPEPAVVENLQVQIRELLRERNSLQEAVSSANSLAASKIGEIAIVRANQSKLEKENEQRIIALQKLRADEAAKHKIEVEKVRAEQEKIAIEKRFLENDLDQGTEQIKNLQRVVKDGAGKRIRTKPSGNRSPVTTPKKNKSLPYGDGFNDDEIQILSPSKLSIRPKASTPKAAGKRKRKAEENSPAKPLPLAQPESHDSVDDIGQAPNKSLFTSPIQTQSQENENFKFMQKIMNHRVKRDEKRSFEALVAFAFPSNPTQALSTHFLDKMSPLGVKTQIEDFPSALGSIIISLWSQCIDEKYYAPVHLLMDLVKFVLLISPPGTGALLSDDTVVYAQLTADVNVIPRFQRIPRSQLNDQIDTNLCLEILHLVAFDCLRHREDIQRFWASMRFDFIVMMLNVAQPMEELHIAINLLRTSVLETSFAMRVRTGNGDQGKSQEHVIERLLRLLIELPIPGEDAEPYDITEVTELRLQVLNLLEAICENKHGGEALATHKDAIGRLVRVMNDELDALYDYQYGHEYRSELVNKSTRLLFHLTTDYANLIDMQAKLHVIPGGTHKYLIALTRLAFTDGMFHEKGIDEDVADYAHQMLETLVNPQEAEALLEAFSSAKTAK